MLAGIVIYTLGNALAALAPSLMVMLIARFIVGIGSAAIAVHGAKNHIRCNAVLPGMIATEAVENHLSEEFRNLFLTHIPLKRMGMPEEIAEAVIYFAGDASAYTTGQTMTVSGGFGLATPVYGELANADSRR